MKARENAARWPVIWTWIGAFSMACLAFSSASLRGAGAQAGGSRPQDEIVIFAFGDSLTAGFRIPPNKAFPAQLEAALRAKGYPVRVLNSGVSGDTAADGLDRLDWSLTEKIDAAIVEFGANDALRGANPKGAEAALDKILAKLKGLGAELLLAGMEAPRNWGPDYAKSFREMYPRLAEKYGAQLYPFFLKDVATAPALNLADGLHPTPEGVAVIVRNILPEVEKLIARVRERRAGGHATSLP